MRGGFRGHTRLDRAKLRPMSVTSVEPSAYELERGKPLPSRNHGIVQANLILAMGQNKAFRPISELTLNLGEKPDPVPDLCVFRREAVDFSRDEVRVSEPPLVVVEIASPTQGTFEIFRLRSDQSKAMSQLPRSLGCRQGKRMEAVRTQPTDEQRRRRPKEPEDVGDFGWPDRKIDRYRKHGVPSCWVVEPALRTVKIIAPDGTESVHHTGLVTDPATGIEVDLDAVFS